MMAVSTSSSTMRLLNRGHRFVMRASGGRLGWRLRSMDVFELATIGRTSGQRRATMLTAPISDASRVVLVASKGGSERHPAWYLNILAHPEVELRGRDSMRRMRARKAVGEERKQLWERITAAYPFYAAYQSKTDREIPVVVCEAVDA